jgi:uncharacterized protein
VAPDGHRPVLAPLFRGAHGAVHAMFRKCPGCGSHNVRRSKRHVLEKKWPRKLLSPYRCRVCEQRFLVFSTTSYYLGGIVGLAIAVGIIGWPAFAILHNLRPGAELAAPAPKAVEDATELAENPRPLSEYTLAHMYAPGDGVPRNEREGHKWLERAAENGSPEAQYEIGMALREGRDVVQDYESALNWLQRAAASGNVRAQFELGHMYRMGLGIPIDNVKAYTWFNLAAAAGHVEAVLARNAILTLLSRSEVVEAQREARRWSEGGIGQ